MNEKYKNKKKKLIKLWKDTKSMTYIYRYKIQKTIKTPSTKRETKKNICSFEILFETVILQHKHCIGKHLKQTVTFITVCKLSFRKTYIFYNYS